MNEMDYGAWQGAAYARPKTSTDGEWAPGPQVNLWELGTWITPDQFTFLLDTVLNHSGSGTPLGIEVGKRLQHTHRTLQANAVRFALGLLCGIADQQGTDARNAAAIGSARKVKQMVAEGELTGGFFV